MSVLWKTIILLSLVALIGALGRDFAEARRGSENGKKTDGNNSYWCPKFKAFTLESSPQRYRARAELTGDTAQHWNGDTERLKFLPFWTGRLKSEVAQFQIKKQG